MYCPCGMEHNETQFNGYSQVTYRDGEIVFAVCLHGYVVINKLGDNKEE